MAEHEHGKMDIHIQEKTFGGFVKTVSWGAIIALLILLFIAMVNG
ncbi:MAG: aa3-type cytochrome c oxidase subunit IV [Paracoccaceae bacterium]